MKTLLALLLALSVQVHAAEPAGKPQQLTTPDQVPEGLAKSDWSSIRAAHTAWEHSFLPTENGWQARNAGQQWTTQFDGRGFLAKPKAAEWQWGLELRSYGFGQEQRAVKGQPAVKAEGQRLSYQWDADVQEWFVNDNRGLEHGFTLARRPAGAAADAALDVVLSTRGTLKPSVAADAQTVHFRDALGAPIVTYAGLKVWDADGQVLPSRFLAGPEGGLILRVQETTARYPITIDPIAQQAYIKPADTGTGAVRDGFGSSVAVSGDTVVVGAMGEDSSTTGINSSPNESAAFSGAAYVFMRNGTSWTQQAYLKASQVSAFDYFGRSVAVSGDTVVIGSYQEDSSTTGVNSTPNEGAGNSGAAYVFMRNGTSWTQQAYLKASQVTEGDEFGCSVAVSGDTLVVGASGESSSTTGINSTPNEGAYGSGAAYVFMRNGTNWTQQAYLKASQVTVFDSFGDSVAVSGDTVVVGASREDSNTTGINSTPNEGASGSGAAYVFVRSGTTWTQQAYLKAHQVSGGDYFGYSVAVAGDTVVVGAYQEDSSTTGINSTPNESVGGAGAAYVYVRSGSTWSQQAYLKASQVTGSAYFGYSVAVSGDTVVVGAIYADSSTTGIYPGAAYVFVRNGSSWSQQAYLKASQVTWDDQFGYSVAVSGDTVVVGAALEDSSTTGINSTPNERALDAGAAYVYVRSGPSWTQQAYLKPADTGSGAVRDVFGTSVAVSGDTVVVGATGEDSSTTGINSPPNESAEFSGAAYVFVRNGSSWTQQAYLKASQVSKEDSFGCSVAVSGNTVVVGAKGEDSSTTGINSTPILENPETGAAYVFVRSGTSWSQQAYLKASEVNTSAEFGTSVAVSGNTVVVGAVGAMISTLDTEVYEAGTVYVFVRSGTTWSQQAYLNASQVTEGDHFGNSVAVSGDTLVVGALWEDSSTTGINSTPNEMASSAGAAYVFVRSGISWSQQAYLKASQVSVDDNFGDSVAVSGDTVVVGASREDSSTTGINSTPNEGASGSGAAYVFVRSGTTWSQQAYIKASQVTAGDMFGCSLAMSGDTVVVGARDEDSSTTGTNSTPNELAAAAGAAYVFVRSDTDWSQQAYLKASQVTAGDAFGNSVAVSGDTVVVGSPLEDSSTTEVNSTPNELADRAGAAYIFTGFGPLPDGDNDGLLDSWELSFWPTTTGHGPTDDHDKDGYVELLELAFGLNPTVPNAGGIPALTEEGGYLTMTLTKQPGVTYEVQSAATLPGPFSAATTTVLLNNPTTLKVRDNVLFNTPPARFMRVQVTGAP